MLTKLLNYFRTPVERVGEDNSANLTNDINEPVLSFVQCFKANPKRFKLNTAGLYQKDLEKCYFYTLTDTLLDKEYLWLDSYEEANIWRFGLTSFQYAHGSSCTFHDLRGVITEGEGLYIRANLREYYSEREERLNKLKDIREERKLAQKDLLEQQSNAKMRNELMEVYCNG